MKKVIIIPLIFCNLISFSVVANEELNTAVDQLNVDKVQAILEKNSEVLTAAESRLLITEIKILMNRLFHNKIKHMALFFGTSFIANWALGELVGLISAKTIFKFDPLHEELEFIGVEQHIMYQEARARGSGLFVGLLGFAGSCFFFPINKYQRLEQIFHNQILRLEREIALSEMWGSP